MDESELIKEGRCANFGTVGAHTEIPGCSLRMGNQAHVREGATVASTSTRNFLNRLSKNADVYLASAELAAIAAKASREVRLGDQIDVRQAFGLVAGGSRSVGRGLMPSYAQPPFSRFIFVSFGL